MSFEKRGEQANMKHLLDVLNTFNQISDQMLMWARQNYDNKGNTNKTLPTFTYKGEPIQVVQCFKYIGINVPSTNRWNVC